ncbi:aminoglycoside phosphotransferase [Carbonactinospora thermoautotrophica]|uniref:hypothetical protein n=1 Tax=Carbonactinospora thermoautotrophica TaxID=1469144 RepID=UPI002271CE59|nr:hypothetical protein [Carbonactinospora thermoautotrophica]MCX9191421.1 aminoglycoside phosphotransferase [Carbonactinospora thermoautotrophica]
MMLEPRFRRVAGIRRPFVDREGALRAFDEELAAVGNRPRVLNITGIGGIGKSRLLREFQDRVGESCRTALLDLQLPPLRQQDTALAVLRSQLGAQGIRFDRYDIAYTALWQRLHPHLKISREQLPLIDESEVLGQILDGAAGVPVFGTVVGLLRLLDGAPGRLRRWRRLREDPTLRELDSLSGSDLVDAVTFLFAEDLRAATEKRKPYVLFVDAFEALLGENVRAGRTAAVDGWLRDLIVQLDRGLVVVASREPLRWEAYNRGWSEFIRTFALDDLPMSARLELLEASGVADPDERMEIARASAGVPFYLHLALDTRQQHADRAVATAVSREEILERFLQHVDPQEVRFLELLSVARTFDFEIFAAIAQKFRLPGHRMAWESLTSYSFVYPAGPHQVQLHQLMVAALRHRLSPELNREVHRILRSVWDQRAARGDGHAGSGVVGHVAALREATYHALHAGEITDEQLIEYADQIIAWGGTQGIGGVLEDVHAYLGAGHGQVSEDLARAARYLDAEAALLVGDAGRAAELTQDAGERTDSLVDGRLAVTGAHARRILGQTAQALRMYTAVWETQDTEVRLVAGLWAADLHMAQGRFRQAADLADSIRAACPKDELLGDAARLLHLAYRFAFDFDGAGRWLAEATTRYRQAGTVIGQANIAVNQVELLAWTDPALALDVADKAIELQKQVGARHELGKAYTAIALAHLRLGDLDRAHLALGIACEVLEQAGYRSGRARAELVRAMLCAREGATERAVQSAVAAVREFEIVEVYPTFVLAAATVLDSVGMPQREVTEAAARARRAIQPFDSLDALEDRIAWHLAAFLGTTP